MTMKTLAFTGAAATLLPDGQTIHSGLAVNARDEHAKLTPTQLAQLQSEYGDEVVGVIVDEMSMVHASLFATIAKHLRAATSHRPDHDPEDMWGGLAVIFTGDFRQVCHAS